MCRGSGGRELGCGMVDLVAEEWVVVFTDFGGEFRTEE